MNIIKNKYDKKKNLKLKDNFKSYYGEDIFFLESEKTFHYSKGWNCYGLTVRGFESEVDKLLDSNLFDGCKLSINNISENIKEAKVIGNCGNAFIKLEVADNIIRNFPNLKVVTFWEGIVDRIRPSELYVVYSESGYSTITNSDFVTDLSAEDEYNPFFLADVTKNLNTKFRVSDSHSGYEDELEVEYVFPFEKEWNTYSYVKDEEDDTYIYTEK